METVISFLSSLFKNAYFVEAILILISAISLDFLQRRLISKANQKIDVDKKFKLVWLDSFLISLKVPLSVFIYLICLNFILRLLNEFYYIQFFKNIPDPISIIFLFCFSIFAFRFNRKAKEHFLRAKKREKINNDITTIDAISKTFNIFIILLVTLITLQMFEISLSAILAFGGIGGIIMGLSAKDFLANFLGALMIYLDRPFGVGDWIRSPDRSIEGIVESIGWRLTTIRTFEQHPLYVPNSVFTSIIVENPERMNMRRINEIIKIRFIDIDKVKTITKQIRQMISEHQGINHEDVSFCNINSYSESSIDLILYTFTKAKDREGFYSVKQDILLKSYDIIRANGAELAHPTQTLFVSEPRIQPEAS